MTTTEALRKQAKKYIDKADEKSLRRVNAILEIDQATNQWWNDKDFIAELDRRYDAMESGEDKGVSLEELEISIEKIRLERYGK